MKKTGTVAGTCPMVWRSTPHTGLLSRPIIGHTPRKLPPCGAISRFIAVSARGKASTTWTRLSYRIFSGMSRPFSLFFIVFLKFFWQYTDAHGSGANVPLRAIFRSGILFPIRPLLHRIIMYPFDAKNTGMLCTPVFLIIYVLRYPAWPSVRRSSPGTLHPSGIPAPGW